jgi:hypothetical protein
VCCCRGRRGTEGERSNIRLGMEEERNQRERMPSEIARERGRGDTKRHGRKQDDTVLSTVIRALIVIIVWCV